MDTTDLLGKEADKTPNTNIVGNEVEVRFVSVGNRTVTGKIDTGASTSSLHAIDITVNKERNSVSFNSPELSNNIITMDLDGQQDVSSADGGESERPTVKFDIDINGMPIRNATFNLNDRSNMDAHILIGQNVLKAGDFQVDVNKEEAPERVEQVQSRPPLENQQVRDALQVLAEHNISIADVIEYFKPSPINNK